MFLVQNNSLVPALTSSSFESSRLAAPVSELPAHPDLNLANKYLDVYSMAAPIEKFCRNEWIDDSMWRIVADALYPDFHVAVRKTMQDFGYLDLTQETYRNITSYSSVQEWIEDEHT